MLRRAAILLVFACSLQHESALASATVGEPLTFGTRLLPAAILYTRTHPYHFAPTPNALYAVYGGSSTEAEASPTTTTITLIPRFPGAAFVAGSGANHVGQLAITRENGSGEHFYRWSTSRPTLQEYSVRVPLTVPPGARLLCDEPATVRYRTNHPSPLENSLSVSLVDPDDVVLAAARDLADVRWNTAPESLRETAPLLSAAASSSRRRLPRQTAEPLK